MIYGGMTQQLVAEVETRPNVVPSPGEEVDFSAMRTEASQAAVKLALKDLVNPKDRQPPRSGQIAQALSPWYRELGATCSRRYKGLTSAGEGHLSRIEANEDPELLALQALRRGIGDARREHYRRAGAAMTGRV